jgi:L-threonylcarbamoyladenylate synthase
MELIKILNDGGVGVLATDTLYGLVARALDEAAIERIYRLKGRRPDKPLIILICRPEEVRLFGVDLDNPTKKELMKHWPGPVSIILPCPSHKFNYLHRGTNSLAFRLPAKPSLRRLLKQTGPLVAPSANPEGQTPASSIPQARRYFGEAVDFYQSGRVSGRPSQVVRLADGKLKVLRP